MEIILLIIITGLVGLAVLAGMIHASYDPQTNNSREFDRQGRDDFFRKIKIKANQLR